MEFAVAAGAIALVIVVAAEYEKSKTPVPGPDGSNPGDNSDPNSHKGTDTSNSGPFQSTTPANTSPAPPPTQNTPVNTPPVTAPPAPVSRYCWIPVDNVFSNGTQDWEWGNMKITDQTPCKVTGSLAQYPTFAGYFDPGKKQWMGQFTDPFGMCGKNGLKCDASIFPAIYN